MSSVIVCDDKAICFWKGEIPKEGDVIFLEDSNRLLQVTSVVHVATIWTSSGEAVPSKMRRIFVEDMGDNLELLKSLTTIAKAGI